MIKPRFMQRNRSRQRLGERSYRLSVASNSFGGTASNVALLFQWTRL